MKTTVKFELQTCRLELLERPATILEWFRSTSARYSSQVRPKWLEWQEGQGREVRLWRKLRRRCVRFLFLCTWIKDWEIDAIYNSTELLVTKHIWMLEFSKLWFIFVHCRWGLLICVQCVDSPHTELMLDSLGRMDHVLETKKLIQKPD